MRIIQLNSLLIPLGFHKKGNNFTKKINDVTYIVNLQKSNYSDGWYINCSLKFEEGKKGDIWFRIFDVNKTTQKDLFNLNNESEVDFIVEKLNEKFISTFVSFDDDKKK